MPSQKPARWKWILSLVLFTACGLGGGGYLLTKAPYESTAKAANAVPGPSGQSSSVGVHVEVIHPKAGDMDRTTSQPGSVHAFESVQLYAGVSGFLKTLGVDIGDRITKDQVLAQVDVPELEKQVQRYSAVVDQAHARVDQMKARAVSARAEWEAAGAAVPRAEAMLKSKSAELRYRQQQLERMRELAASKSIEDKIVDEYTSHRDAVREGELAAKEGVTSAKANLAAMAAKILAADADVHEAVAQVKVAEAELEKAQVLVKFATVPAPFDGIVTQRNFFPHDFVRAANEGGAHVALLTVQRTDQMRVVVQIPDRDVPYCDPGDPALVEIDALPGQKLSAKVSRVARSEDHDTRLMHVEIDLPNPTGKICNGMYGRVTIILQKTDLLAVPSSSLVGKAPDGKGSVYVVRDGRAQLTPVTVGADNGRQIAILSGLTMNDQVILRPGSAISDGTPVVASSSEAKGSSGTGH